MITITGFSGLSPRTYKRLLAANRAQVADNCRLTNGQVAALRDPVLVHNPSVTGLQSIFRMVSGATEKWLTWAKDVDAARGPVDGDTLQRIYWTGDNEPRMSTYSDATGDGGPYPSTFFVLGVFPPKTAPGVSPSGGTGAATSRAYLYTFKTQYGEEGQPSPASAVTTGKVDDTWALSAMDAAPPNSVTVSAGSWSGGVATLTVSSTFGLRVGEAVNITGVVPSGYNATGVALSSVTATQVSYALVTNPGAYTSGGTVARVAPHNTTGMKKRIYRTITAASGETEYRFVAEIDASTTTYNDVIADSVVAIKEKLPSTDWEMPPTDMKSVIALANGIMAAFAKNEVCLSEPFLPHAWPSKYRQTANHNIVAIGFFDTTIVAATDGAPYTMQGVEPVTMGGGMRGLDVEWPCVSKRSLVSTPFGVMYAAPQGLALHGMAGSEIVTRDFYTAEEWRAVKPETFVAAMRDNKYYAKYDVDAIFSYALIIDKSEFAAVTRANHKLDEFWTDKLSGKLYVVQGDKIKEWDAVGGIRSLYDWMSKEFVLPTPVNLGACKIDAEFTQTEAEVAALQAQIAADLSANQGMINAGYIGAAYGILPIGQIPIAGNLMTEPPAATYDSLLFELYAYDVTQGKTVLKFAKQVKNNKAFTLPAKYKSDAYAVRLAGNVAVTSIKLATTMDALRQL